MDGEMARANLFAAEPPPRATLQSRRLTGDADEARHDRKPDVADACGDRHFSPGGWRRRGQVGRYSTTCVHIKLHPLPPSHCSPNDDSMMPSPQYGAVWQVVVHLFGPYAFCELAAPWSHCSAPFLAPSPQYGASVQSVLQPP